MSKKAREFWRHFIRPKLPQNSTTDFFIKLFNSHDLEFSWDFLKSLKPLCAKHKLTGNFNQFLTNIEAIIQDSNTNCDKQMRLKTLKILKLLRNEAEMNIPPKNFSKYTKRFEALIVQMPLQSHHLVQEEECSKCRILNPSVTNNVEVENILLKLENFLLKRLYLVTPSNMTVV